jgi:class 3 adenylate cyclase
MGQVAVEKEGGITRDAFGRFVNRAARIVSAASGGQTLASYHVWDSAIGWLSPDAVGWRGIGEMNLKGFTHPVPVYEFYPAAPLETGGLRQGFAEPPAQSEDVPAKLQELIDHRARVDEELAGFQRMVAVMFADMVGSTSYFERFGDVAGLGSEMHWYAAPRRRAPWRHDLQDHRRCPDGLL